MGMVILIGAVLGGAASWYIRLLRAKLATAEVDLDQHRVCTAALVEEHGADREKWDRRIDELDRECESLYVENRLRREYAYVCRECKQVDTAVQATRERNLRSVTNKR